MSLFNYGRRVRSNPLLAYAFGIALFVIALIVRFEVNDSLPQGFPYLTFFPAVILSTFIAGTRPGIVCATLSGLASLYFFIPPFDSFAIRTPGIVAMAFYIFIVTVDIALIHYMAVAAERLRAEREVTRGLYDQQRTMFQELQHRVANNMTFVASLLSLQKRAVKADPSTAAQAFDEASHRITVMSRVHRRLYDPASVEMPIGRYFEELCADLMEATGTTNVACHIDMPDMKLDLNRLMALSLIVTELMTNSLKHAFEKESGGAISLTLKPVDPNLVEMAISDNGRGLPDGFDAARSKGLGNAIVHSLVQQIDGNLDTVSDRGVTTRLRFAA